MGCDTIECDTIELQVFLKKECVMVYDKENCRQDISSLIFYYF